MNVEDSSKITVRCHCHKPVEDFTEDFHVFTGPIIETGRINKNISLAIDDSRVHRKCVSA